MSIYSPTCSSSRPMRVTSSIHTIHDERARTRRRLTTRMKKQKVDISEAEPRATLSLLPHAPQLARWHRRYQPRPCHPYVTSPHRPSISHSRLAFAAPTTRDERTSAGDARPPLSRTGSRIGRIQVGAHGEWILRRREGLCRGEHG